ncbi:MULTISPECIES: MurR/RpiR family transcriptional regulator [unclassified Gilliamella]|uniref:MurR/RpiR family transcriptional regulator n=1 Tax=unclassified Gilliamella TaxID=2685620 RepID=UPI00226A5C2E|nr:MULTISPECIES: MurR/RpiR family transcriptional regulator [unclassified Gilliamella]MCX8641729.1 MurR/RpiR family transcriptional regulator [Gilliamella sp. B3835]MCX8706530.1 MurR/RpiR family transcriptional regulator [Gilliamella sp. B3783]MCX8709000.1 MurR/RpiR family transcriptional regulator [Gilliamella sp. B3780]MCX8712267.1 MurR/RpiR family transcriptional regulator [Gilliamella sp. B3468]MCX8714500.1 MurR/RpiR family transcriptional regulator [Gilliamella sp. B3781]
MIDLKLREVKKDLSAKELAVATFIQANTDALKNMSIQSLAKLNQVSTSTILRLCNKLGYSGFSDFKVDLISSLPRKLNTDVLQDDINLNDSLQDVNNKVQSMEKSSIDETHSMINLESLNKAIDLIIDSNKIIIFGASSSGLVGKELEYQLIKIKKDVSCHFDSHIQKSIANNLDGNDLIIIISHSGETPECIDLLKLAQKNNVRSIAITKMGQSQVSSLAEVILHTTSTEHVSRLIPIRSKISQISVINMLVTNLFIRKYDERLLQQILHREERKYPH